MTDNLIERARFVVQLFRECDAIQLPHKPTEETVLGMIDRIERLSAERDKWHTGWMEAEAKVSELEAERDALKAELHEARMQAIVDFGKLQEACEERDALKAEVERLQEALTPFAEAADEADDCGFDDFNQAPIDCGQCREARAALQESTDD